MDDFAFLFFREQISLPLLVQTGLLLLDLGESSLTLVGSDSKLPGENEISRICPELCASHARHSPERRAVTPRLQHEWALVCQRLAEYECNSTDMLM
jgi:hypothetical protein